MCIFIQTKKSSKSNVETLFELRESTVFTVHGNRAQNAYFYILTFQQTTIEL